MQSLIKTISKELNDELKHYDAVLINSLNSDVKLINTILKYILKYKGKQFRPILSILSSNLENKPNEMTYIASATVEMLHVATLLHDDVVDDATVRRGWPTANSIWKSKLAILVGDYMFSRSLNNIVKLKNLECIEILANISNRLSKGEILQIENAINKEMSEEVFFKMIGDKTASLISASCKLGFITVNKSSKKENIGNFGEYLGIAYQLKDDLFDVMGKIDDTGKQSNLDLKKNLLTLPYIYVLNSVKSSEKRKIIRKMKYSSRKKDFKAVKKIIENYGGIEYTENKIKEFSKKALEELNVFENSKYKDMLVEMLNFNLVRKY
tara:strand:- start:4037 stop:5011 length:975 start_codon:yes stop_codon:yes gene_type:complete